jgi:DNA-binding response OmpR family regulator
MPLVSARLLVLEDDDGIRASLALALEDEGYLVLQHAEAESALQAVRAGGVDLMLVDLMLGGLDGFTFIRQVRPVTQAPIIVVSARSGTSDIVEALQAGADDYVTKPYVVAELVARVRALMRRPTTVAQTTVAAPGTDSASVRAVGPGHGAAVAAERGVVLDREHGPLVLDADAAVLLRGTQPIGLTMTEFRLLVEFTENRGRVLSREALLQKVWDRGFFGDERIVDVHVRRLRMKIEQDPGTPDLLVTVRGLGYRLDPR